MKDNVVDFKPRQDKARHQRKEENMDKMQQQFERALPTEKSPKEKLLGLFKKKKNTRTPKKSK